MKVKKHPFILLIVLAILVSPLVACATAAPAPTATTAAKPTTAPAAATTAPTTAPAAAPTAAPTAAAAAPTKAAELKTLKFGYAFPTSGFAASFGIPLRNWADVAVDLINAKGPIKLADGDYKVQAVHADSKFEPAGAATAASRLINDEKIDWFMGATHGLEAAAQEPVLSKWKGIAFVDGWLDDVLRPENTYFFRSILGEREGWLAHWYAISQYIKQKEGKTEVRLALLDTASESGDSDIKSAKTYGPAVGITLVASEQFQPDTKDFTPYLTKILAQKPDMISTDSIGADFPLIIKQARALGYKGRLGWPAPVDMSTLPNLAGGIENLEGFLSEMWPGDGPLAIPGAAEAYAAYQKKTGSVSYLGVNVVQTTNFFYQGLLKAGTKDPDKLKEVFESGVSLPTPFGPGRFAGKETYGRNHQIFYDMYIAEVQNGKVVPVISVPNDKIESLTKQYTKPIDWSTIKR